MSNVILIFGHSDDLIEVEGAVNDELSANYDEPTTVVCSDGRRFTVTYDGEWSVECDNPDEDVAPIDYSDIDILPTGTLPETANDYTEVAVYRSWNKVESVELA